MNALHRYQRAVGFAVLLATMGLLAFLGGCSMYGGSGSDRGEVTLEVREDALAITNGTAEALYYDAIDVHITPLILRLPFSKPDVYSKVGAGQTLRLPYDEIYVWEELDPGGSIAVTVWRLVPDRDSNAGFRVQALIDEVVEPPASSFPE